MNKKSKFIRVRHRISAQVIFLSFTLLLFSFQTVSYQPVSAAGNEILANGGYESGNLNWWGIYKGAGGTGSISLTTAYNNVRSGSYAALLQPNGVYSVIYQDIGVISGKTYNISAYVKASNGHQVIFGAYANTSYGVVDMPCQWVNPPNYAWTKVECNITVPQNTNYFFVYVGSDVWTGEYVVVDDWSFATSAALIPNTVWCPYGFSAKYGCTKVEYQSYPQKSIVYRSLYDGSRGCSAMDGNCGFDKWRMDSIKIFQWDDATQQWQLPRQDGPSAYRTNGINNIGWQQDIGYKAFSGNFNTIVWFEHRHVEGNLHTCTISQHSPRYVTTQEIYIGTC